jgi:translation initiation factor 3 subunit I
MRPNLLHIHERPVTLVKFNYDGDFFVTSAKDGECCLMRADTCERVGTYNIPGDRSAVYAVDITLDSRYVVTAKSDGKMVFYTFEGEKVQAVQHGGVMKFAEWNQKPGDQNFVVTCNDKMKSSTDPVPNRIMVWQFQPLKKVLSIDKELPMAATKVKWGPFDETLVSIFEEGMIIIWDAEKGTKVHQMEAHRGPVTNINFTEDRMLMISCGKDQTAKLWSMDEEYEQIQVYETDRPLNDAAISPLYNMEKDAKYHILMGGGQDAKDVTTTASSSGKFEAVLWHMVYCEEIGSIKGHFGPMNTVAWRRDGKGFVTGGEDGYVRVHMMDKEYFSSKKFE